VGGIKKGTKGRRITNSEGKGRSSEAAEWTSTTEVVRKRGSGLVESGSDLGVK